MKIFSAIRPSGKLHIGNYFGSIKNWVNLQDKSEQSVFAVADYHGITTPFSPREYRQQIIHTAASFLAAGIDPKKSIIIRQSKIPEHTELAWILNTITPVSWLRRMPTLRDKVTQLDIENERIAKQEVAKKPKFNKLATALKNDLFIQELQKLPRVNTGLVDYPVLMAADILIYGATHVPVGEDQLPHLDLTNEIARKFNSMFGETFHAVERVVEEGSKIMSLQKPGNKMSKTGDESVYLVDEPEEIKRKIKRAITDSDKEISYNPNKKPAISSLLMIYHLASGKEIKEIESEHKNKNYLKFKVNLAETLIEFLRPLKENYDRFSSDSAQVEKILTESEKKAKAIASETLSNVKNKMGLP